MLSKDGSIISRHTSRTKHWDARTRFRSKSFIQGSEDDDPNNDIRGRKRTKQPRNLD